jgi:hypothetical protein
MRAIIRATLVALSGFTLHALGCAEDANTVAGATTTTTTGSGGLGGQGGEAGQGGTGGEACVASDEVCDNLDNNCDGVVDEGCACAEGDVEDCYAGPPGTQGVGLCVAGQRTCDVTGTWGECMGAVLPREEDCNNEDDDCNGGADDLPDLQCGVGNCQLIIAACTSGVPNECIPGLPSLEVCDGIDNDCDQLTDETFPGKGTNCDTGVPGICAPGLKQCVGGVQTCVALKTPTPELCDTLDTDCDGVVDNNIPGTGGSCTTGIPGACSQGSISCQGGIIDCFSVGNATPELCNGIDDNCDGEADEGNPDGGATCVTGIGGACDAGTMTCVAAAVICVADNAGLTEICNGADDQCNGQIDEDNPGGGYYCPTGFLGACADGTTNCESGVLKCNPYVLPEVEACDGLDNDCDGMIDDGNPDGGAVCDSGKPGICGPGTMKCTGGALVCTQNNQPIPEICGNGLDDNCDGNPDPNVTVVFGESFSNPGTPAGWTLDTEWAIGPAVAGCLDPGTDTTPTPDNRIAGVVIGGCASTPIHAYRYLTSPVIDTSALPQVYLDFRRWLRTDYTPYMNSTIEVFNGTSWVMVWQSGSGSVYDTAWQKITHNLTAHKNANMRVRWGFNINSGGVFSVGQWNIDDVTLTDALCQ